VKIRDREIREPPHVTVIKGSESWRYDLREQRFMDREPPPRQVPDAVVDYIEENMGAIADVWDAMYPDNPVEPETKE